MLENVLGMVDSVHQLPRAITRERESGAGFGELIVRFDGIFQTADFMDDGNCAIAQRDQLCKSTGFESGGDQQRIDTRIDLMRQRIRIIDLRRHTPRILALVISEHVLVMVVPGTQHDKIDTFLAELIHDLVDEVQTFLVGQPRYDSQGEGITILFQAKFLLQCKLVLDLLLFHILDGISGCEQLVGSRIPDFIVDSVHYPEQPVAPPLEDIIQTVAEVDRLYFLGIGLADRSDIVGIDDTSPEHAAVPVCEIHGPVLERTHQPAWHEAVVRQTCDPSDMADIPGPLETDVVDRHDRPNALEERVSLEHRVQVDGNQCGLPVMAVDDIRPEIDQRQAGKNRLGEKREPFQILEHVVVRDKPAEISFIVDEIIGDSVKHEFMHTDIDPVVHLEIVQHSLLLSILLFDGMVVREDDTDVERPFVYALGQASDYIGQATRLCERNTFRRDK